MNKKNPANIKMPKTYTHKSGVPKMKLKVMALCIKMTGNQNAAMYSVTVHAKPGPSKVGMKYNISII